MSEEFDPPYRFPGAVGAGTLAPRHEGLATGASSGERVRVAGRIMLSRPQGRLAFCELRDWSGAVQLFAQEGKTVEFESFTRLNLGDWVGAEGEIIRTRRGELSVLVSEWVLLAASRQGFGDKWRGVRDTELRYRQREVDLWANEGSRETFLARSRIVRHLRNTLDGLGFVEVETPVLQPLAGGANAKPFLTHYNALDADFSLRVAPELYLKRLVIGGFERVFEIGKVFRNEGISPRHNPEFTMLEAYQAYGDYTDMAGLLERLVASSAEALNGSAVITFEGVEIDLTPPWRRATLTELVEEVTGTEANLEMGRDELARRAAALGVEVSPAEGAGRILYALYEKTTEHALVGPVHVMDYPEEVSPLTRRHRSKPGYVERLTPIIAGREIAEAYSELVDPDDQRRRFTDQASRRAAGDEEAMALDEEFLRALGHGLPPAGGIGLGIDRLTMLLTDKANIREVVLFPALRPERAAPGDAPVAEGAAAEGPAAG
ncbi:MAG TPA: lysine--tRNA ligase [Acidimicrobiales bacterium]|nr:lysine--tRNA ligase [Acidimicrobiales bacterium]